MPIEITDVDGGIGNIITYKGIVTEEEYLCILKKHLNQPEDKFSQYRFSITDMTGICKAEVTASAIRDIADECVKAARNNPDAIVATVADQDLVFGLVKMSIMLRDQTGWESRIFQHREDAEAWVRSRAENKFGITGLTFS